VSVRTGSAEVEITDAGGAAPSRSSSGHGLTGMRERVAALDGTLAAEPVPGGGFRLLAAIPLNGRAASPLSERTASPLSERTASPVDGSAAS
jgi:glucose-6-phosphate-specific signal transduction histidine kinase